jgi:putative phage-type endonuclease
VSLTPEQKAIRRTGITATDIGAILGLSPFKSPLDVYLTKVGEVDDVPAMIELEGGELRETADTERGRFLEPALVQWAGAKIGLPVEHTPGLTVISPRDALIIASPDGLVTRPLSAIGPERRPLEVKAPGGFFRSDEWGPDGSEQVPADYEAQIRWQMAAESSDEGYLAALIGPELRVYRIKRDLALEAQMVAKAREWWARHVLAATPPAATTSERDQRWLKRLYPNDKLPPMKEADLSFEQRALVSRLMTAYRERKVWKDVYERLQVEMQEILGDHAGLTLEGGGRIDWKSNKPGEVTDWEGLARDLHRRLALVAQAETPGEFRDVRHWIQAAGLCDSLDNEVSEFTKTVPGNRVFRPWPAKESK